MIPPCRLQLDNLPAETGSLVSGCLYAIAHDGPPQLNTVLWRTLLAAAEHGQGVWITHADPAHVFGPLLLDRHARHLLDSGRLRIYRHDAVSMPDVCAIMNDELARDGVGSHALVVIDDAGAFSGSKVPAVSSAFLRQCRHEADTSGRTLLLLYPHRDGHPDPARELLPLANHLAGLARLSHDSATTSWETLHWFGSHGIEGRQLFHLQPRPDGGWHAEAVRPPVAGVPPLATEAQEVFLTRTSLTGTRTPPAGWQVAEDLPALVEASRGAHNATLILHLDRDSDTQALAHTILELRSDLGNGVRILVREINVHVRHAQQRLLQHAGADIIVPAEAGFSWIESLVGMLAQQVRKPVSASGELPVDFLPARPPGYLDAGEFAREAGETLLRSRTLAIHNALVRFKPTADMTLAEIVRQCALKRRGDLCTDDGHQLYVFLFACRESDLDATLDQLFLAPRTDLFASETRLFDENSMRDVLDALSRTGTEVGGGVAIRPPGPQPDAPAQPPVRMRQPRAAIRRPLPLRSFPGVRP